MNFCAKNKIYNFTIKMPRPSKGEQKNDFMKRCIPELIHEGHEQKQGIAACFGIWGSSNKWNILN